MESAVLISIKPEWCEKILSGKKTVEIRKTFPHDHMPFKCYIYCTKPTQMYKQTGSLCGFSDELYRTPDGKIKYGDSIELMCYDEIDGKNFLSGKVIGEFTCDEFDSALPFTEVSEWGDMDLYTCSPEVLHASCLTYNDIYKYGETQSGLRPLYFWYISNLKIYDRPKELCEFTKYNKDCYFADLPMARPESCSNCNMCRVTRAPQSWMYVEELEDER